MDQKSDLTQKVIYLGHLAVQGDSRQAEVTQHERDSLGIGTGAAEDDEGVAGQLVEDVHQIDILYHTTHPD